MTGKITPLYVVCSPCRCVGKTLLSRLITEFYIVTERPILAFDLSDEAPQLADYLPKFATVADIGDIQGQMALFDRLIAERRTPIVIDVSHRAFKHFFTIMRNICFFDEARRHSIEPLILFIVEPNATSTEAYAMLRQQFIQVSFLTVRNQLKASARRVMTPNVAALPSSIDIPILSFSLRALIDQDTFSFSQLWQANPAGLPDAVADKLLGWLEYIFDQFRNLEISLCCEDRSALLTTVESRILHTTDRRLSIEVATQRRVDDLIDKSGEAIFAMLQRAAELSNDNCAHARSIANKLSRRLRATQDRINELDTEIEQFRSRALYAERWLQQIQEEIEQKLIDKTAVRWKSMT